MASMIPFSLPQNTRSVKPQYTKILQPYYSGNIDHVTTIILKPDGMTMLFKYFVWLKKNGQSTSARQNLTDNWQNLTTD